MQNMKQLLLCTVFFCFSAMSGFAEEMTITTYYPSPHGVYNQLRTYMFAVGADAVVPSTNGVANFQVIGEPATGVAGDLYYDSTVNGFRYHNGTGWQSLGGGASLGGETNYNRGTTYTAATDGLVYAYAQDTLSDGNSVELLGYTGTASATQAVVVRDTTANTNYWASITFPVKKGYSWHVSATNGTDAATHITMISLGS